MKITLKPSDSLFNAGLIGFYNILKFNKENVQLTENELIFDSSSLENFSDKYFTYISYRYEKLLSVNKLIGYRETLNEDISIQDLKKIMIDFKKITSKSYMGIFQLFEEKEIIDLYSSLKIIDKKSTKEDIKFQVDILNKIINRLEDKNIYKHLCVVNSAYTVINKTYENVAFFNSSNKDKNFINVYDKFFTQNTINYLSLNNNNYTFECTTCGNPINDLSYEYSFITGLGYPSERKSNFGYNFNNEKAMCPMCRLIYTCICAGATLKYDDGFFINFNSNLKTMLELNNKLFDFVLKSNSTIHSFYEFIMDNIQNYNFEYTQLLKYNNNSVKPHIQTILLNKEYIDILTKHNKEIKDIGNDSFEFAGEKIYIFTKLNELLYNNDSINNFINLILYYKLSEKSFIKESTLDTLIKINYIKSEGETMEDKTEIKQARIEGYKLRDKYIELGLKDKIKQNSHTLYHGINSKQKFDILNIILKMYLYANMELPNIIAKIQDIQNDTYKILLQSFLVGFMSTPYKKNKEESEE